MLDHWVLNGWCVSIIYGLHIPQPTFPQVPPESITSAETMQALCAGIRDTCKKHTSVLIDMYIL